MYQLKFIDDITMLPKAVETIKIGQSGSGRLYTDLVVFQDDKAILHLNCNGGWDEYQFTREALIWSDWVVVGSGHRIYLYELKKQDNKVVDLGAYFCKLHTTENCLFAASGERIHALDSIGEILWISDRLGIDGVVINGISDNFLLGEGEFDPPGGWEPFKISLADGKVEWL